MARLLTKANGYTKTQYVLNSKWGGTRRVYKDSRDYYYTEFHGHIVNVTEARFRFEYRG